MATSATHFLLSADIDTPLNQAAADKVRDYRADYNNCPSNSISFVPAVASTSGRLHCEYWRVLIATWKISVVYSDRPKNAYVNPSVWLFF
jgi:hypothetical protein